MTFLTDGIDWLNAQLQQHAGRSATYTRGVNSVAITATVVVHDYEIHDESGVVTVVNSFDLIAERATLTLNGSAIDPRPGDRIAATLGGAVVTLEVVPIGRRPCVEWLDEDGTMVTIHTKRVG